MDILSNFVVNYKIRSQNENFLIENTYLLNCIEIDKFLFFKANIIFFKFATAEPASYAIDQHVSQVNDEKELPSLKTR